MTELYLDVETTTRNKGHPFDSSNFLVSYSCSSGISSPRFHYFKDPDFTASLRADLDGADCVVGFAVKFDLHWTCRSLGLKHLPLSLKVWDCQLAEFILSGQTHLYGSLNETLEAYGLPLKFDQVAAYWEQGIDTCDIPVEILEEYGNYDTACLIDIKQLQMQRMTPAQIQLCWNMGEDLKALQHAEALGIRFDTEAASNLIAASSEEIRGIEERLETYLPDSVRTDPGISFNWDSGDQLSCLIYGGTIVYDICTSEPAVYKSGEKAGQAYVRNRWSTESVTFPRRFLPLPGTEVLKTRENPPEDQHLYQVDTPTLSSIRSRRKEDKALLQLIQERSKKIKVLEMVSSILKLMEEKGWADGFIHAQFNQNVARTGRLSSSAPNMQNTPSEIDELLVSRYV